MVEFKLVIGDPKTGKCYQKVVQEDAAKPFLGLKIGDTVKGEVIDLTGYEFLITGGSDYAGFPMRKDVQGPVRKRILAVEGVGIQRFAKKFRKNKVMRRYYGTKQRRTVAGNTVHAKTAQINLRIMAHGAAPLVAPGDASKEGEKKEAQKKEDQKPATK